MSLSWFVANITEQRCEKPYFRRMESYIKRCFQLAKNGLGNVAPNPMVGCVIVLNDEIIGEGFHTQLGFPHAEVQAINSVHDHELLKNATLYVNLEPCSHHGKTPPCADLIISKGIKKVVISNGDPNPLVNGKGIEKLRNSGIEVITEVLEKEGLELNRRFFTFHTQKRPFIILKWAQTADGFIDKVRANNDFGSFQISGKEAQMLNHQWRTEESAILIGSKTALIDNPSLTARLVSGKNPLRIVIDQFLTTPSSHHLLADTEPLLVFNAMETKTVFNKQLIQLDFNFPVLPHIISYLHYLNIQSVIVEGGAFTIQQFIDANLWDEARVFQSNKPIQNGLKAPSIQSKLIHQQRVGHDQLYIYRNPSIL